MQLLDCEIEIKGDEASFEPPGSYDDLLNRLRGVVDSFDDDHYDDAPELDWED